VTRVTPQSSGVYISSSVGKVPIYALRARVKIADVVKRVIRNHAGSYLKADGTWTNDFWEAEMFSGAATVIAAKQHYQLSAVYLVILLNDEPSPQCDIVLPLEDAKELSPSAS